MQVADRSEIYEGEVPVGNRGLLSRLISRMNKYAYDAAAASEAREEGLKKKKTTDTPDSPLLNEFDYELNKVIQLLSILYDTHSRRPLVRNDDWVSTSRGCLIKPPCCLRITRRRSLNANGIDRSIPGASHGLVRISLRTLRWYGIGGRVNFRAGWIALHRDGLGGERAGASLRPLGSDIGVTFALDASLPREGVSSPGRHGR